MKRSIALLGVFLTLTFVSLDCQGQTGNDPVLEKVNLMLEKKAEYHKLTNGEIEGYRIKIHFGVDREATHAARLKFSSKFSDISTYEEYQQPNFVVLVGDYKTKLEAFEALKKIQVEMGSGFIVKGKIRP